MEPALTQALASALADYRKAAARAEAPQEREDYSRLAFITEKLLTAMRNDDLPSVKMNLLGFSRQVSDAFSTQPPEFKALAERVAEVKRLVI